ncbi:MULTISPECIES: DHH family phosphoesterase [Halolamina]|uniref:RecJ-like exonuclease, contains DnaJ-type Zn finger domain n=1 Tax=Halolamina pelagica TaxID=699431 RepID=A0A1I5M9D4_9EURY|nr:MULTISPECIES: OB-fold nucleic acid binding domain-containing protein [Halolamina]NHX35917.1 S1 RNA-binding domain-containing protein [Halolamina sp. R1-12]SFP05927.1 RecJ-like exonuclease, contains DnaJ-type Zn finger domain [Halolamina pelagica]
MGNCIICGADTQGHICQSHEEDVVFEFRGDSPDQLVENRFYRGVVDGYADFGVFIDLSPSVTGLLHRSELEKRLESLDWEAGDTVFVQVKNVRDNGNVDLTTSIRQADREFRGSLIQDGTEELLPEEDEEGNGSEAGEEEVDEGNGRERDVAPPTDEAEAPSPETDGSGTEAATAASAESETADEPDAVDEAADASGTADGSVEATDETEATETTDETDAESVTRRDIGELSDRVGENVRIEGEVVSARQTGGPTVFEIRDETGVVDCAAFVEAGVRAYPEIEVGDVVRLDGEVEIRHEELQVETEALVALDGEDREAVERRLAEAMTERARPDEATLVADDESVAGVEETLLDAAEAIRRAVLESRPIVVRHAATADGYVAGVALERAILPMVREEHAESDAEYHYVNRRPLEEAVYEMNDATNDVTSMLQDRDRHDEKLPLVVLAGTASTVESEDGLEMLGIYGADRVVVDAAPADPEIADASEVLVNPAVDGLSTGALAASLATTVSPEVREEIAHLPAVSYWETTPQSYLDAAREAGFDEEAVTELREAIALEAYYQSYDEKRELVGDLLFGESVEAVTAGAPVDAAESETLAGHIATQFREKMDTEVETARANLERSEAEGVEVAVLDTEEYTHKYDFPPSSLLLDELHRRGDASVTIGIAMDELWVRADPDLDLREVAHEAASNAPGAGISAAGLREGRIEFLSGARQDVEIAVVGAVVEQFD